MSRIHQEPSPFAGQTVTLSESMPKDPHQLAGRTAVVEDWWDRVAGISWMDAEGNPAALTFAMRSAFAGLPLDNEVLYVKVDGLGHIVHESEIAAAGVTL